MEENLLKTEETLLKGPAEYLHYGGQPPSPPLTCLALSNSQQAADLVTIFLLVLENSWLPSRAVLLLVMLAQHGSSTGASGLCWLGETWEASLKIANARHRCVKQ